MIIALGSNASTHAGDSGATVHAALDDLRARFDKVIASDLYQTPAFPAGSGPDFVNVVCTLDTLMPAADVMLALHDIEASFDRERKIRWGQRTLDLDLIAYGDAVLPDTATHRHWRTLPLEMQKTLTPDTLILPHPRIQDRAFVLVPMADVAPDWVHPVLGRTTTQMLADLPAAQLAQIVAL